MDMKTFLESWLPARQHSNDFDPRVFIECSYPFEFHCYESWGVAFYVRFDFSKDVDALPTRIDALHEKRFGPFESFDDADAVIKKYYEDNTGKKYQVGDNCHEGMRKVIQS